MIADRTGAATTVSAGDGAYSVFVEGEIAGKASFADRGNQRVFYHTEIDKQFGGRGLATILVEQALIASRDEGKRIVAVCSMVAGVLDKHPEFNDITDPPTPEIEHWVQTAASE